MSNEMLAHRIGLLPIHVSNVFSGSRRTIALRFKAVNDSTTSMDITADNIDVYKIGSPDRGASEGSIQTDPSPSPYQW
jgi:DNA-directed RNA polymerase alpha subunit